MNKAQALESFREMWAEQVAINPDLRGDTTWKREDWSNYTDHLCKTRQITSHQYDTWSNPF